MERRQGQPVAIDEANQGAAGTRVAAATDGANSGRTLTLALLVASLLVAAALAFVSIRSVKIRLARLVAAAGGIAAGELSATAEALEGLVGRFQLTN